MAATGIDLVKAEDINRPGDISTWGATVLACVYFAWTGVSLYYSTPRFIELFNSLGLVMSFSAAIVFKHYRLVYPVLFGGMAAVVIIKQFYVREK